jgi:energy-coupling factor transporter ATP-binding protein EcfA2
MDTINELEALMADIKSQNSSVTGEKKHLKNRFWYWYHYLESIKKNLGTTYKLVFIGQKGSGKTTTILELFGLNKKIDGKEEELLVTGAGGTTLCEVELLKSNKPITYFEIEPVDGRLFNQSVDAFCSIYDESDVRREGDGLPSEIKKAITNMAGLKLKDIKSLRKEYKDNNAFKEEINRRIDSKNRNRTIIDCQLDNGSFFADCQNKFFELNLGRIKDVMLPR